MAGGHTRRRKADRPTEILAAALQEFSAKGFAATRLDDVAARAGITKGTIYVYFASKEDLFLATLAEKSRPMMEHLQAVAADPNGSALDILRHHLSFVAEHMVEDPCGRDILRILLTEGHRFPQVVDRWYGEVLQPALTALAEVLRRGVERGEFRTCPALDYPELVMAPMMLCHNWQAVFGEQRPLDIRSFFDAAIDLMAKGLLRE